MYIGTTEAEAIIKKLPYLNNEYYLYVTTETVHVVIYGLVDL